MQWFLITFRVWGKGFKKKYCGCGASEEFWPVRGIVAHSTLHKCTYLFMSRKPTKNLQVYHTTPLYWLDDRSLFFWHVNMMKSVICWKVFNELFRHEIIYFLLENLKIYSENLFYLKWVYCDFIYMQLLNLLNLLLFGITYVGPFVSLSRRLYKKKRGWQCNGHAEDHSGGRLPALLAKVGTTSPSECSYPRELFWKKKKLW